MWTNKKARRWKRYYLYNCTSRRENWGAFGALSLSLVFFFNARLGYDISAHEYGMYRDTCSLSYEFEIATFLMSLQPGTRLCLLRIYFIQNEMLLCFVLEIPWVINISGDDCYVFLFHIEGKGKCEMFDSSVSEWRKETIHYLLTASLLT